MVKGPDGSPTRTVVGAVEGRHPTVRRRTHALSPTARALAPTTSSIRACPPTAEIPRRPTPAARRCSCIRCSCPFDRPKYLLQRLHGPSRLPELLLAPVARPCLAVGTTACIACKTPSGRESVDFRRSRGVILQLDMTWGGKYHALRYGDVAVGPCLNVRIEEVRHGNQYRK